MNCREVLAKVYEYLDSELGQDENKQVKQHLEFCSHCLKKYQIEEDFNNILKQKSKDQHDVSRLKDKIRSEIGKIDSQTQSGSRNISFLVFPLVAAVLIAVVVFVYNGSSSQKDAVFGVTKQFAEEHSKCLQNLFDGLTKSEDPVVIKEAVSKFAQIPEDLFKQASSDIRLHAGGMAKTNLGDQPMLEYKAYGEDLSVFILPANQLDKTPFRKVEHDGEDYYVGSCPKYHYVIWQCEGHECVGVSKLPEEKLASIAFLF